MPEPIFSLNELGPLADQMPVQTVIDRVGHKAQELKMCWLRSIMVNLIPPKVMAQWDGGKKQQAKAGIWLKDHGFVLDDRGDMTYLLLKGTPIGRFNIKVTNGQLVVDAQQVKVMPALDWDCVPVPAVEQSKS